MIRTRGAALCCIVLLTACASSGPQPPQGGRAEGTLGAPPIDPARTWPVRSFEHIDLWFHGYAMLTADTARVPFFSRGYREQMLAARRERSVYSALDANRETLSSRFTTSPGLNNGQFVIFSYQSFEELVRAVELFVRVEGSPAALSDPTQRALVGPLTGYFRTAAERDWLRLFTQALQDERTRFYGSYWNSERNTRNAALNAVEALWANTYRDRFARFLRNSRQGDGTFILSMPLDGEGRSILSAAGNAIAVSFPPTADRAVEAIYVFAHEMVGNVSATAITDNITPAQVRAGDADRYSPIASVRGGAYLLQRVSPDDVAGYMRYYLRSAGLAVPGGDPTSAFNTAFTLPEAVIDGIRRHIDAILAGI